MNIPVDGPVNLQPDADYRGEGLVAVIVGIDGYTDMASLRCATNDAVSLSETLKKVWRGRYLRLYTLVWPHFPPGSNEKRRKHEGTWGIELPPDARGVTREGILSAIRRAARHARQSDTLLFFFAGHGSLTDGEPSLVTIRDGETGQGIEYLGIKEIQAAGETCASRKRVMILDCCQTTNAASLDFVGCLRGLTEGWSILASCSPGESSLEDYDDGRDQYLDQGVFTASLVEGLRGGATVQGNASVTLFELAHFVCKRVQAESEERISDARMSGAAGERSASHTTMDAQHPVLLSQVAALGGPLRVVMAPAHAPSKQDLRRSRPSRSFLAYWRRYLFGRWPVEVTRKHMLREGGAFLYGGTMLFTLLWFCPAGLGLTRLGLSAAVGLGSALLWWLMIPFAVAANEDGWLAGGYVTGASCVLWHAMVLLSFSIVPSANTGYFLRAPNVVIFLGVDLFLIMATVIICGCNASQAIIALAETIRKDERREIREAISAFRQFRKRFWDVDLFNLVAMVSARPSLYHVVLGLAAALLAVSSIHASAVFSQTPRLSIILLRNAFALVLVAWQVFWYQAAFKFIQKEVYKR